MNRFHHDNDQTISSNEPAPITIALLPAILVTGIFWSTWFTRSIDIFPADNFIRIGKNIINNVAWPMRILMPATLLLWLCLKTAKLRPSFLADDNRSPQNPIGDNGTKIHK
jgi:hypothetical protein